ncbi:replication endonuclease [Endozoicomonas sp.]|uniref:replication endonuclease n=1 Tax=Endozoicomonas sp. TaxID=1892382 RepID=UPI003AF7F195
MILAHYQKVKKRKGRSEAIQFLIATHKKLNWNFPGLKLSSSDDCLKSAAKLKAESLEEKVKYAVQDSDILTLKNLAETYLKTYGLELPLPKRVRREPSKTEILQAIAQACNPSWWRRQLRVKQSRELEQFLRELGQVSADHGGYVSGHTLKRREKQRVRNRENLELMEAVNQYGESFVLAELADKNVSNPAIRRNELIVRTKGLQEQAAALEFVGVFITQTAPSRFHTMKKRSGGCYANPSYELGLTPRDAQAQMMGCWQRTRAEWDRQGVRVFGFCMVEPHHDGTPHWHSILFVHPEQLRDMVRIYREYVCEENPEDLKPRMVTHKYKGGWASNGKKSKVELKTAGIQPRFDWKLMRGKDGKPGGAVEYVLKYICKNLDGAGIKGEKSDETGGKIADSVLRVEAWKAVWGIRQFRQVGAAPVGVYRELRKISEDDFDNIQDSLAPESRLQENEQKQERSEFLRIREAADKGDFGKYVELQGGATLRRKYQKYKNWTVRKNTSNETENRMLTLFGLIMQEGQKVVKGIKASGKNVMSRFYDWTVRFKEAATAANQKDAGTASSWTCVNNCTGSIQAGAG